MGRNLGVDLYGKYRVATACSLSGTDPEIVLTV